MDKNLTVEKTIQIQAPAAAVWDALVNPDKIKVYFFGTEVISDWTPGSRIIFQGEYQGQQYQDGGTILDIRPAKLLQYTYWSSMSGMDDKQENYALVTYQLSEKDGSTELRVEQKGFAKSDARNHAEQNWTAVLDKVKELSEGD
jgi:uncharacterized protein YndB with AHSA1/START domain